MLDQGSTVGLTLTRADRADRLADALAARLATPLPDPLATEQVVVHSRGIERWLSQHLSRTLGTGVGGDGAGAGGICANVAFPFPAEVVAAAMRAAGGPDPRRTPWTPDRLVWSLLQVVDEGLGAWAAPLTDRLQADPPARLAVLRGVAEGLDAAAVHRPDVVLRWLDGDDVDAAGRPLPDGRRWQPQLLRHLRERLGQPTPAELVVATAAGIRAPDDLPPRLSAFGFTALPAAHLAVLAALARVVDVDLYLLHPSPALWDRWQAIAGSVDDRGLPVLPLRAGAPLPPPTNRLLRSWGRDAAEMQVVVQTIAAGTEVHLVPSAPAAALPGAPPAQPVAPPASLLAALQAAVRDDRQPDAGSATADASLQVHACHGPARQVQVLRDEVLRLLAADPTLQPRDVVVMCPDVEVFAPLVQAHLAVPADDPDGRPDLRVRLADRALRQVNPVLRAVDDLLALAAGRVTLSRLLDLAGSAPVRRRFGFGDDDLAQLRDRAAAAGIRWGLDGEDRARDGVPQLAGTAQRGLTRMLLGVAMADEEDRTVAGVTPLDGVEGDDVVLLGRFAELVDRLRAALSALRRPQPIAAWATAIGAAADALLLAPPADPHQRAQLGELLTDVVDRASAATGAPPDVPLDLIEVRGLLADRLRGAPSWADHRTGDLTVCTLVPMRSVPHRVVCLLGMDDDRFPRQVRPAADDLIALDPRVGDRDPRTEDRQLLLDAVMAASDAVVVTYTGVDDRTGLPRPPCVPVMELLRAVDGLTGVPGAVVTTHPLHPHDPRAFTGDRPGFDPAAHAGAVALTRPPAPPSPPAPIPVTPPAEVPLDRLVGLLRHPVGLFHRHTVGVFVPDDPDPLDDQVPLALGGLDAWSVGTALLVPDADAGRAVAAARGRGLLPPAGLDGQLARVRDVVADIRALAAAHDLPLAPPGSHEVDVVLGGRRICGTVPAVEGSRHVAASYSKVVGKGIAAAWVHLLALTLDDPRQPWEAVVLGRHETATVGRRPKAHGVRLPPLGPDPATRRAVAAELLGDLLALHDDALAEPLVAPAATACAYAMARVVRGLPAAQADDLAAAAWDHGDHRFGADADLPGHLLLFGESVPYEVLRSQPPRAQDVPADGPAEPHRFGALAVRLWAPVLRRCAGVPG